MFKKNISTGNPIITHKFTADPTALIYQGIVFLITGHDEAPIGTEDYVMNEWLCFSSTDMVNWKEHPVPFRAKDFSWAKGDAYAAKVIEREGQFYLYATANVRTDPSRLSDNDYLIFTTTFPFTRPVST